MYITYDSKTSAFILQAKSSTYILRIECGKYPEHVYWGNKIESPNVAEILQLCGRSSHSANSIPGWPFSLDTMPSEYPVYSPDLRLPAFQIQSPDGYRICDLVYKNYSIINGKPGLSGLPSVYVLDDSEAETLQITLTDELLNLDVILSYTVLGAYDSIIRSVKIQNKGTNKLQILRALSMSVDFPGFDYDMVTLSGSWARERHIVKRPLVHGTQSVESRRGASGLSENPFLMLADKNATEVFGDVYGFSLVYSGNFYAGVDVEQYSTARVSIGINPFDFSWLLEPGEEFTTPEAVMVYSSSGFGDMSRTYHSIYRNRLARGKYKNALRPVLINNWEATYFDFNEEKITDIAREASKLGIEMLVLDDGWFGKRNDDRTSLGDWFVNKDKLPNGLSGLADAIESYGIKFGLWMEPEMVSPDSELYRRCPDWCLHVPERYRSTARSQLILDYSRKDVQDYIIDTITDLLSSAKISYVKWDMNRNMSEIGSDLLPAERQMETCHRYMLGLYHVLETITGRFPNILFESCASGGGRFDPGMLYYMPQCWTSDDTDAAERLKIQFGTSLVYPSSAMTAHVSACPNHQSGRTTSLAFRGNAAMSANFGYELDVTRLNDDEKAAVKKQVSVYKEIRSIIQYGDFYRLLSPFTTNYAAWMYVNDDKSEAVVFFFRLLNMPNDSLFHLKLTGLNESCNYKWTDRNITISGQQLMNYGLNFLQSGMRFNTDYESIMIHLIKIN